MYVYIYVRVCMYMCMYVYVYLESPVNAPNRETEWTSKYLLRAKCC